MRVADRSATEERGEDDFDMRDAIAMGLIQCIALVPGRLALRRDDRPRACSAGSTGSP